MFQYLRRCSLQCYYISWLLPVQVSLWTGGPWVSSCTSSLLDAFHSLVTPQRNSFRRSLMVSWSRFHNIMRSFCLFHTNDTIYFSQHEINFSLKINSKLQTLIRSSNQMKCLWFQRKLSGLRRRSFPRRHKILSPDSCSRIPSIGLAPAVPTRSRSTCFLKALIGTTCWDRRLSLYPASRTRTTQVISTVSNDRRILMIK